MAGRVVFIGDEIAAAGFRLAGIAVRVPRPGEEAAALREESAGAALLLLAGTVASRIPAEQLRPGLALLRPLVLVVPDGARPAAADIGARVRLQLGLSEG